MLLATFAMTALLAAAPSANNEPTPERHQTSNSPGAMRMVDDDGARRRVPLRAEGVRRDGRESDVVVTRKRVRH